MKNQVKNVLSVLLVFMILIVSAELHLVRADDYVKLKIQNVVNGAIDLNKNDNNALDFFTDSTKKTLAGTFKLRNNNNGDYYGFNKSDINGSTIELNVSKLLTVELNSADGFKTPSSYSLDGNGVDLTTSSFDLKLSKPQTTLDVSFISSDSSDHTASQNKSYQIVAYFEGVSKGVVMDKDSNILLPSAWTKGSVTFTAYALDDVNEIPVRIEGIANLKEINNTVVGSSDKKSVEILDGFIDYGKLSLHITKLRETDPEVNSFVNIVTDDLITIRASAKIPMSHSLGTVTEDQAIITKDEPTAVKIFFGNTETTLFACGSYVVGITDVTGPVEHVQLNTDGSATLTLPPLSEATSSDVKVTIKLNDGSSITRSLTIARTAIQLQHTYGNDDNTVYAGYVVNKGYLYNNSPHDDTVFDAYLQVILYKDDVVAGYKQVKIDDEKLVNSLKDDQSGSLELYDEAQFPIYGKATNDLIDGVNKVSVFLTNGPIDFDGDMLPSVEFGIGSGVVYEWGALA